MITGNRVLDNYRKGKVSIGCQLRTRSSLIAEVYGLCGFDFVFIEGEHFPYNDESVLDIVTACENRDIEPFFRLRGLDSSRIMQCLDIGVKGLLCPHIDSGELAAQFVDAGKFQPLGQRGFSNTSRATDFGRIPMQEFKKLSNDHSMLVAFIESSQAVANITQIIGAGVDGLHLGPGDLSESYQCEMRDPVLQNAMDMVIEEAHRARIPVFAPAANVQQARDYIKRGIDVISYSSDLALLREAGSQAVQKILE